MVIINKLIISILGFSAYELPRKIHLTHAYHATDGLIYFLLIRTILFGSMMQNYNYIKSNVLLIIAMPIIIVGFYSPEVLDACDGSLGQVYYPLIFAVP